VIKKSRFMGYDQPPCDYIGATFIVTDWKDSLI